MKKDELLKKIGDLREQIQELILKKAELTDPEILGVSRMIDTLLNEYEKLIKKMDHGSD